MKTKLAIGTVVLAASMLLSGCGGDKPEDVATSFANALSEADLKETGGLVSRHAKEKLTAIEGACGIEESKLLAKEAFTVIKTVDKFKRDKKFKEGIKDSIDQFKKDKEALGLKLKKEVEKKYGSFNNVPREEKEKIGEQAKLKLAEVARPVVDKQFELLKIKTENTEAVKEIVSFYITTWSGVNYGTKRNLRDIAEKYKQLHPSKVTKECVDQYTDFGLIDKINVIETKESSPDEAIVRLEIIHSDGKSKKVSVDVEKIKSEWKISDFPLNNGR